MYLNNQVPKRIYIRKDYSAIYGKRSSQRIRLKKHELSFIERISPEEFEKQKGELTQKQVQELQATKEYKRVLRMKGRKKAMWNWQTHEDVYGTDSDVSSEFDIITNHKLGLLSCSDDDYPSDCSDRVSVYSYRSKGGSKKVKRA